MACVKPRRGVGVGGELLVEMQNAKAAVISRAEKTENRDGGLYRKFGIKPAAQKFPEKQFLSERG